MASTKELPIRPRSQCPIQRLPADLILAIYDHIPFSSHFDFASTCKHIALASQRILKRHQDAHSKYATISDLDPATVPLLLRSAYDTTDSLIVWHVRAFEVWRDRVSWKDWHAIDIRVPRISPESGVSDADALRQRVSSDEVQRWLEWFRGNTGWNSEATSEVCRLVEEGYDGMLKALLIAKCPRLRDVKFVTRGQEKGSALASLQLLMMYCLGYGAGGDSGSDNGDESNDGDAPPAIWPVGLCSIRSIAVGVTSNTWLDDFHEEPSVLLFAYLLRLPELHSIYYSGLRSTDWNDVDGESENYGHEIFSQDSSSVQHIFLHGCDTLDYDVEDILWCMPENLLTMSFRYDGNTWLEGTTATFNLLAKYQGYTLQELMWYGYDNGTVQGDHCYVLGNEEFMDVKKSCITLMRVSVCTFDIQLALEHSGSACWLKEDGVEDPALFVSMLFPLNLETLVLWDAPDWSGERDEEARLLDTAFVELITGGRYPNLKSIHLVDVEQPRGGAAKAVPWFQETVKAGLDRGVDVHTLMNRKASRHEVRFFEAPDEFDLVSGLHGGIRPSGWVFDPYLGRRVAPGCGGCGRCQDCLGQYTSEAWKMPFLGLEE